MFKLDEQLKKDCFFVSDLKICSLLLMNNANFPWLILVPREHDLTEFSDVEFDKQIEILKEINLVSKILQKKFLPKKINIATLGNVVRQLHIHVIARFENDKCFPKPVWGSESIAYEEDFAQKLISEIKQEIENLDLLKKQLLYRSIHRGCKETDHLIGEFAKQKIEEFDYKNLLIFQDLIIEDDLLIYDWILKKENPPQKYLKLIGEMQKFHNA